jgi:predicted metalloprotease
MELDDQRSSDNVEDRRGIGVGGGLGIGGVVIVIIAAFMGVDPTTLLNTVEESVPAQTGDGPRGAPVDPLGRFVSKILGSTEDVWSGIFQKSGSTYAPPTLVLYSGAVRSACGLGQSAMGPFYCPNDQKLYIDLSFYDELRTRFKAPGDFAQAYVIAHEVGHHVQNQMGTFSKLEAARGHVSQAAYNQISVRMELQADCYAGVWGHFAATKNQLDPGDADEALTAASAIGDDRMQRETQGRVVPESFTHGTSAQRVRWFKRGMDSGRPKDCDTFSSPSL